MIKTWKHKGLQQFFLDANKKGINPEHTKRLTIILQLLDVVENPTDLNLPGFCFHELAGNLKEYYSVKVNGNWRVIFQFKDKNAFKIDYLDYH